MTIRLRLGAVKPSRVAALILLGCLWMPLSASAQLGSLVVTITAPQPGATLGGKASVSASVTIVGALTVAGVQFKLDGANLGAEDTTDAGRRLESLER